MNFVERLREWAQNIRRKPAPLSDAIPMVCEAADRIEALEAALRYVREMIGPSAPECSGCATEWGMAIAKINEVLK